MAVMKCKMCGGDLEITEGSNIAVCEYCGTKQTVPTLDNERKTSLFGRAGRLLRACEFDKASVVFGDIVSEFPEEAEAYWGLLLCKYGVEYVDDPATGKKIPTCHRLSFNSVMEDSDFEQACENADSVARGVYREEAKFLETLRKNVIEVSSKEEPYDVFICYKETDANGNRTIDSVMAQDVYDALTEKGLRVFFARITLEDKLGMEYEPYIFAALNSAKVMLAIGTDYEYFNAVWVKNEWSRFLKLIAKGEKKVLVPCYKNIDAYDMPDEFKNLQAQDMGKLGFMQDLTRGVCKIVGEKKTVIKETVITSSNTSVEQLLKRAYMALEDGDFAKADAFCEQVLNIDAENAKAYLGKLLAELRVSSKDDLSDCDEPFGDRKNYGKALRFGDAKLREELEKDNEIIRERNRQKQLENFYKDACRSMDFAKTEEDYKKAADAFKNIIGFKDSDVKEKICLEKAEEARKEEIYFKACSFKKQKNIKSYENAILHFEQISGFKDSAEQIAFCRDEIEKTKSLLEKAEIEKEKRRKKNKNIAAIAISTVAFVIAAVVIFTTVIQPMMNYNAAVALFKEEKFEEAIAAFEAMEGYKDSGEKIKICEESIFEREYNEAVSLMNSGKYPEAIAAFRLLEGYRDSKKKIAECDQLLKEINYDTAVSLAAEGKRIEALMLFGGMHGFKDSDKYFAHLVEKDTITLTKYRTIGLKSDGTVAVVGYSSSGIHDFSDLSDIVSIDATDNYAVCLKSDGTLVSVGDVPGNIRDNLNFTNVLSIKVTEEFVICLKADGTVVAEGSKYLKEQLAEWKNIVAIDVSSKIIMGLKSDGTVVTIGDYAYGQCDVSGWTDIVAISAGYYDAVGLKSDGTVVYSGSEYFNRNFSELKDIVAIANGVSHTVGLKSDGTVIAVGRNYYGECNVSDWTDIVAIAAGEAHTVGVKADGSVVAVGWNDYGQCNVSDWTDIKLPEVKW